MSLYSKSLERINGQFVDVNKRAIKNMSRSELVSHLESRGFACYDDESIKELRECALEDLENG